MEKSQVLKKTLSDFTIARGRPVVLLHVWSLRMSHVIDLRRILGNQKFEDLDVVINSPGGSMDAAYLAAEILRSHSERIRACVPFCAKSAATLLCLGADEIWMDELADLGPLDPQVYGVKSGEGEMGFESALNPFRALEKLQEFSLDMLDVASDRIAKKTRMNMDQCLKHAVSLVLGTMTPLFTQLNPEKIGQRSRDLEVASEYGKRLMNERLMNERQWEVLKKLVYDYPSHDFVLAYRELSDLGFNVKLFPKDENEVVHNLTVDLTDWSQSVVTLCSLVPEEPSSEKKPIQEAETS